MKELLRGGICYTTKNEKRKRKRGNVLTSAVKSSKHCNGALVSGKENKGGTQMKMCGASENWERKIFKATKPTK